MEHVDLNLSGEVIDDAAKVAAYLKACPVLVAAAGLDPDPLTVDGSLVVPIGVASDGTYIFPLAVEYFVRVHGAAPDVRLLNHIRSLSYTP